MNTKLFVLFIFLLTPLFEATAGKGDGSSCEWPCDSTNAIPGNTEKCKLVLRFNDVAVLVREGKSKGPFRVHTGAQGQKLVKFSPADALVLRIDPTINGGYLYSTFSGKCIGEVQLPADIISIDMDAISVSESVSVSYNGQPLTILVP